jgi:hypothetical protein
VVVPEQPGTAFRAGVGKLDRIAQHRAAGLIPHQYFQS